MPSKKGRNRNKDRHAGPLLWIVYACAFIALPTMFLQSFVPGFRLTFFQGIGFQSLVTVMFAAWLALAVADPRYRPRRSAVVAAVCVYVIALLASLLFAADPWAALWSSERRMTGIWFLMHCAAWFLVLSSVLRTREEWRPFLWAIGLTATVMASIGVGQSALSGFSQPAIGTLGNPSFLAALLLMGMFVTGYLFIGSSGLARKVAAAATALQVIAIVLTASRGALVSLMSCLLLGAVGFSLVSGMSRRRKLLTVGGTLFLISMIVGIFVWTRTPSGHAWFADAELPYFVKRVALKDFGRDRLVLWDIALKGIKESPWVGYGGEQFEAVFGAYYDPYGSGRDVFYERWFDRAHSQVLDGMISYGVLGMAPFAAIWLAVAAGFARAFRRSGNVTDRRRLMMLLLATAGYLTYSVFVFDTTAQLILLYALLAYIAVALPEYAGRKPCAVTTPDTRMAATRSKRVLVAAVPLSLAAVWFMDVNPAILAHRLNSANALMKTDRASAAVEVPEVLGEFNPFATDFRYKSISYVIPFAESVHIQSRQMEGLLTALAREGAAAAEARPTNIRAQLAAAVMHRLLGEYDESSLDAAERYVDAAERVAPGNHAVYQEMGEVMLLRGNPAGAVGQFEKALGMVFEGRGDYRGNIRYRMACAYAMMRDYPRMFGELEEANRLGYRSQHDVRLAQELGRVAEPGDDLDAIREYLDGNLRSYPDHPQLLASAATIYAAMGDEGSADLMVARLGERDSEGAAALRAELFPPEAEVEKE